MKVLIFDADPGGGGDSGMRLGEALALEGMAVEVLADPVVAARTVQMALCDAVVVCVTGVDDRVLDWCARLREAESGVALVVVADEAAPERVVAVLDAGADDCVTRPVRLSEIAARLRAVERRGRRPRPAALTAGSLTLDPAAHRAWRDDVELELSATEFALLAVFLRRPGEALSRAELLDLVWNRVEQESSNVVDRVVARLRRVVDEPFGRPTIHTVRGVGYRLDPDEPDE